MTTGTPNMGGTIALADGVIFVGGTIDRRFRAFDAETGTLLWETTLEASAHATPMTYQGRDGRQYVVIAAGGGGILRSEPGSKIVAFALSAAPKSNYPMQCRNGGPVYRPDGSSTAR